MATTWASFFGREDSTLPDQPNGWLWDNATTGANITIRQAYERYVVGATKPPEVQYQRYYDATKERFMREGYSEKEVKWWFLRTGQGPACYRQMQIGVPCGLPPYDVWYNWYIMKQPGVAPDPCFYVWADRRNNDCYLQGANPIYPPPGYSMPGMPCNVTGKRPNLNAAPYSGSTPETNLYWNWFLGTGPWPFPDLPELTGDPNSFAFSKELSMAYDAVGVLGAGFCSDAEVDESAGFLHPVPRCYTVFMPSSLKG